MTENNDCLFIRDQHCLHARAVKGKYFYENELADHGPYYAFEDCAYNNKKICCWCNKEIENDRKN